MPVKLKRCAEFTVNARREGTPQPKIRFLQDLPVFAS